MNLESHVHLICLAAFLFLLSGATSLAAQDGEAHHGLSPTSAAEEVDREAEAEKAVREMDSGLARSSVDRERDLVGALRPDPATVALFPGQHELATLTQGSVAPVVPGELLQARARGSVPLMAAGATLLVAGAIIGDDAGTVVMVGGAGLLAWGVYLHF